MRENSPEQSVSLKDSISSLSILSLYPFEFHEKYEIPEVFDNPLYAVIARIEFIQRT